MKVLHLCLSCYYVDGYSYQENQLVRRNVMDGHEVLVIASTEQIGPDGGLYYSQAGGYEGTDGAPVVRLPYRAWLPHKVMRKLRSYLGLRRRLEAFQPDVILFHGACAWDLRVVASYVRSRPQVTLYVDSHEDRYNSATNFLSKHVLHRGLYRGVLAYSRDVIKKLLCCSVECMEFVQEMYGFRENEIEFFPLGGEVFADVDYNCRRLATRDRLGLAQDSVLFTQSGKMGHAKKLVESLMAFTESNHSTGDVFAVAGHVLDEIKPDVDALAKQDTRIRLLGWQGSGQLADLLCATDVYVQPGTQSATLQNAICARCAVIVDNVPSHHPFVIGNGWMVSDNVGLKAAITDVGERSVDLASMSDRSLEVASRLLDYKTMARRIAPIDA